MATTTANTGFGAAPAFGQTSNFGSPGECFFAQRKREREKSHIEESQSNDSFNVLKALEHLLCLRRHHSVVSEQRPQPRRHHQLVFHLPNRRWRNQQDSVISVNLQRHRLDLDWEVLLATQSHHLQRQVRVIQICIALHGNFNSVWFYSSSSFRRIRYWFRIRVDEYGHNVCIFIQYAGIWCEYNVCTVCVWWFRFKYRKWFCKID